MVSFFLKVQFVHNGDSWHKKKSGADFWRHSCGITGLYGAGLVPAGGGRGGGGEGRGRGRKGMGRGGERG